MGPQEERLQQNESKEKPGQSQERRGRGQPIHPRHDQSRDQNHPHPNHGSANPNEEKPLTISPEAGQQKEGQHLDRINYQCSHQNTGPGRRGEPRPETGVRQEEDQKGHSTISEKLGQGSTSSS